jgi:hypothetical protein
VSCRFDPASQPTPWERLPVLSDPRILPTKLHVMVIPTETDVIPFAVGCLENAGHLLENWFAKWVSPPEEDFMTKGWGGCYRESLERAFSEVCRSLVVRICQEAPPTNSASCGPQKVRSISRGDVLQPIFVVQSAEHLLHSYPTIRQ